MREAILSMQVPHVDSILDNPLYLGACGQAAAAAEGDEETSDDDGSDSMEDND